jgi:hypothetical protein
MAEEILGFWDRLEFFFLSDDKARWKAIGWIILVVGVCGSIDLALLDSSVDDAVLLMGALALIMSIFWIGLYCSFGRSPSTSSEPLYFISRRAFVFQAGTLIAFILSLRLPHIEAREVERKLQQASDKPLEPESAEAAQRALAAAREGFLKIDSRVVGDTGGKFLQTADQNSSAWSAVREYLSYRSFLNADLAPSLSGIAPVLTPATGTSKYRSSVTITDAPRRSGYGRAFTVYSAGGYASGAKSARLEQLSGPQPDGSEVAYFIIDGGEATVGLDDAYMRNVIIRNSDISYAGGRVKLENVWFINCTFRAFGRVGPQAKPLGGAILAHSNAVTFQSQA